MAVGGQLSCGNTGLLTKQQQQLHYGEQQQSKQGEYCCWGLNQFLF
jgi:hypothetical protein